MSTEVKCITASQCNGQSIYTLQLKYPRIIHGEFMTHRMFSRNASSSRAIPVKKQVQDIAKAPFIPKHWGKNKAGMQAQDETIDDVGSAWLEWNNMIAESAMACEKLEELGVHKQWANRWLEPASHIGAVVTATEWDNFFKLRCHADAQPEIRELAEMIRDEIEGTFAKPLFPGEWHLPYILEEEKEVFNVDTLRMASVARCARVSYRNHDKSFPDMDMDVNLATKLLEAGHMSPFEHQATPVSSRFCASSLQLDGGETHIDRLNNVWSGNFKGWIQHRQLL